MDDFLIDGKYTVEEYKKTFFHTFWIGPGRNGDHVILILTDKSLEEAVKKRYALGYGFEFKSMTNLNVRNGSIALDHLLKHYKRLF